jgi:gamma-glutamylcyclotransferase (GGCT)/AIG2-like uncharacterized protein YtfP
MDDWLKFVYENYTRASGFNEYWYAFENYLDAILPHTNEMDNFRKRLGRFEDQIKQDGAHETFFRTVYSLSSVRDLAELQPRIFQERTRDTSAHDAFASDYSRFARGQNPREPLVRVLNLLYTVRCNAQHGQKILPDEWDEIRARNQLVFSLTTPVVTKIDELLITFYLTAGILAYGTLQEVALEQRFGARIERVDGVHIKGHLYCMGEFPAWRYQTWGRVHGCILQAPLTSRLDFLHFCDEVEGNQFQRRLVLAYDENGNAKHIVWAYHYCEEPQGARRIEDGVWRGSNSGVQPTAEKRGG